MQLSFKIPKTARQDKALIVLRAAYAAKPGKEKRDIKRALKKMKAGRHERAA